VTTFDVVRSSPLPAAEALSRLTDFTRHADFVPLTSVSVSGPRQCIGTMVVTRTGLGPARFEDPMEVVAWHDPEGARPGVCRLEKRGRVLHGWAQVTVSALQTGCLVHWHEVADLPHEPRFLSWLIKPAGKVLFGRLVDGLLR
jgi:hypothetical protein